MCFSPFQWVTSSTFARPRNTDSIRRVIIRLLPCGGCLDFLVHDGGQISQWMAENASPVVSNRIYSATPLKCLTHHPRSTFQFALPACSHVTDSRYSGSDCLMCICDSFQRTQSRSLCQTDSQ